LFFSLIIIVVSFLPVFYWKHKRDGCFAHWQIPRLSPFTFSSILAITVVPVLIDPSHKSRRLRPEEANPISRFFQALYLP